MRLLVVAAALSSLVLLAHAQCSNPKTPYECGDGTGVCCTSQATCCPFWQSPACCGAGLECCSDNVYPIRARSYACCKPDDKCCGGRCCNNAQATCCNSQCCLPPAQCGGNGQSTYCCPGGTTLASCHYSEGYLSNCTAVPWSAYSPDGCCPGSLSAGACSGHGSCSGTTEDPADLSCTCDFGWTGWNCATAAVPTTPFRLHAAANGVCQEVLADGPSSCLDSFWAAHASGFANFTQGMCPASFIVVVKKTTVCEAPQVVQATLSET